jgi:amino acid transporter
MSRKELVEPGDDMPEFKRILVPIDFSDGSREARPRSVAATAAGNLLIEAGLGIACLVVVAVLVAAALSSETLIARLLRTTAVSAWLSHVLAGAALLLLGYLGWRALSPIVRDEMNDRRTLP